jgi:hypothetical protein
MKEQVKIFYDCGDCWQIEKIEKFENDINDWLKDKGDSIRITQRLQSMSPIGDYYYLVLTIFYTKIDFHKSINL